MTFLFVVLAIGVIAAVAVLITGRYSPSMGISAGGDYRPDHSGTVKNGSGSTATQFDVVVRGYRMDEVDAKITELESKIQELGKP